MWSWRADVTGRMLYDLMASALPYSVTAAFVRFCSTVHPATIVAALAGVSVFSSLTTWPSALVVKSLRRPNWNKLTPCVLGSLWLNHTTRSACAHTLSAERMFWLASACERWLNSVMEGAWRMVSAKYVHVPASQMTWRSSPLSLV